jgi:N-acyl-phosphatidylethanolamine-hydrolysing phospholipase D
MDGMLMQLMRFAHVMAVGMLLIIAVVACATKDESRVNRVFNNNYSQTVAKPWREVLRWQWEAFSQGLPKPARHPTPVQAPDLSLIQSNGLLGADKMRPAVTWIGHATMLVQANGLNVLTDPMFSERAAPVQFVGPKRTQPPGVAISDLPSIDVVLISHNHFDHLDTGSIQALEQRAPGKTLFLVPLGLKAWMSEIGVRQVKELDWWQHVLVGRDSNGSAQVLSGAGQALPNAVEFNLTPVQHWSARGLGDKMETLWGGWAVFGPGFHWYFAGDSGYSKDFSDTRERFAGRNPGGFDLCLLPLGAYEPRWFLREQHMNPAEAVQAHKDLGSQRSVGLHWGTFNLTDESLDRPPADLAEARVLQHLGEDALFVLSIGETRVLPRRP